MQVHQANLVTQREIFHEGECELQAHAGSREHLAEIGDQLIRDYMPDQHRRFFQQLPFVVIGSVNTDGQPIASILANQSGFMTSTDARHLMVNTLPSDQDMLTHHLKLGAAIALLGIEPHTRRRNRMNGFVQKLTDRSFTIEVQHSFGNCPKYIQPRQAIFAPKTHDIEVSLSNALTSLSRQIISHADTFFIASAHPNAHKDRRAAHGVDISHRGGKIGFVSIADDQTLIVPDYTGNRFFNTLGNLMLNPKVSLLFIDVKNSDILRINATAEVIVDNSPSIHMEISNYIGAERLLKLTISTIEYIKNGLALRWSDFT